MDTTQRLKSFFASELQAPNEVLVPDYPLIANKIIDSMGIFKVVAFIESEYGVTVDDEDLVPDNFGTLASIAALVDSKLSTTHS